LKGEASSCNIFFLVTLKAQDRYLWEFSCYKALIYRKYDKINDKPRSLGRGVLSFLDRYLWLDEVYGFEGLEVDASDGHPVSVPPTQ
jgi:hypothetical protein